MELLRRVLLVALPPLVRALQRRAQPLDLALGGGGALLVLEALDLEVGLSSWRERSAAAPRSSVTPLMSRWCAARSCCHASLNEPPTASRHWCSWRSSAASFLFSLTSAVTLSASARASRTGDPGRGRGFFFGLGDASAAARAGAGAAADGADGGGFDIDVFATLFSARREVEGRFCAAATTFAMHVAASAAAHTAAN